MSPRPAVNSLGFRLADEALPGGVAEFFRAARADGASWDEIVFQVRTNVPSLRITKASVWSWAQRLGIK